ncbi:Glutamate--cysteine ligase [Neolecta irregularis DAH-3]|uniref:Glutamate--cysteine ligase n=1 Tax=Neolecta irregularis (strain DAH-3) TaxID=1198029 RepID=A0A1U7LP59_NEOID|nr:Glutamate--cysteine ligase [Neolecta irregularis DAH-3]|eukprot:OLL24332.1 Glutamate--cysteine ligase [Neolecta irregularis DAH-3]
MGLLTAVGAPLSWQDTKKHADHVRYHGITQFINIWRSAKNKERDALMWGDEIEYHVIAFDDEKKNAKICLRSSEILQQLKSQQSGALFHEEYGRYMLESTPGTPYTGGLQDLLTVETNMLLRRRVAKQSMNADEYPITIPAFPRLGAPGQFTEPYFEPSGSISRSLFIPDEIINAHFRFPTLTANIRERRKSKVAMNVPVFVDTNTPRPFIDAMIPDRYLYPEDDDSRAGAAKEDHIYMDAMGFGMGCCCLQITFQAKNVIEARRLYDQLAPVGPIMLALTAASPIWRGYLADQDARWNVIAGSVDDRTEEERGLKVCWLGSLLTRGTGERPLCDSQVEIRYDLVVYLSRSTASKGVQ